MEKEIFAKIDSYADYAVELQTGLTERPAISPESDGEGEYEKAVWLEGELEKLKFDEITRIDAPHKEAKHGIRPNIIARYKGQNSAKTLWIMTHLDVVPPGDIKLWKTDPFKLHREGNRLYGRGVEDNQQDMVASLLAMRAVMECGYRPPIDIGLLFNADEEMASEFGVKYILEEKPNIFGKNDMFIVPDNGDLEGASVITAEKSILWLKIKTVGKQSHAAEPHKGVNSFRVGIELLAKLIHLNKKFDKSDKVFDPPMITFEPTKKEINVTNVNTIPGEDVAYMDCRVLPEYSLEYIKTEVRRLADEVEKSQELKYLLKQ
ncbi:MAG: M20 family metallo-hydrolase [Elusimicrobia bacterium]|nr:M20 family metallo-hydrolase [Elusimicrobiota bacterium]